ncbi:hypothetical protein [Catellatospora sp. NPDC049609]|uniref:hypothetical protein n=1 Tax=Catellatospora sp. NPDC049609 TaxID=3155505 RepID=UPI00342805D7
MSAFDPLPATVGPGGEPGADAAEPEPVVDEPGTVYHGRRRVDRPAGRRRVPPAAVATVLAAAVVVAAGIAWLSSSDGSQARDPGVFAGGDVTATATGAPAASASAVTTPAASAPAPSPSVSPSAAASPAAFGPVAYEAEASGNTLLGQAAVVSLSGASGGRAVRNIGNGAGAKKDGGLRFNAVTVPEAGTYTLTFYYAQLVGPRADRVVVTVAGGGAVTAGVAGGADCCASRSVSVRLRAGANAVTFGNPDGPAPAIDRIVVRRA